MNHKTKLIFKSMLLQTLLLILSLVVIVPVWMLIVNSFKDPGEAATFSLKIPSVWKFSNYMNVFIEGKLLRGFLNSSLISFSSVFIVLFTGALASYTISRRNNRITDIIFTIFLLGLICPPQIVPTIKLMQTLGLQGTYIGIILFYSAHFLPFVILLISGFVKSVPREIDEAAMIDGCRPLHIFLRIIFPILTPIFVTTFVLILMFVWNDFHYPLYLLNNSKMWTMPLTVFNFTSAYGNFWNYVFANLIMTSLPVVIVYIIAQKYIISGLTAGAIKG